MSESLAQAFLRYVHEDLAQVKQPHFDIAWRLSEAKRLGYAEQLGYKNIYELGEVEFGFKRSSTAAYIAVDEQFLSNRVGHVQERWRNYSFSQLVEMLPLDDYDRTLVQPDWTVKQIRQWRKDHKRVILWNGRIKFWGELTDQEKEQYERHQQSKKQQRSVQEEVSESVQTSGQFDVAKSIDEATSGKMVVVSNVQVVSHLNTNDDLDLLVDILKGVLMAKCGCAISVSGLKEVAKILYIDNGMRFTKRFDVEA